MHTITVTAKTRDTSGKETARKFRSEGYTPAVFYGYGIEPVKLVVDTAELVKQLGGERPEGTFVKLKVDDNNGKVGEKLSIIKDLQIDSLKRSLIHVDFYEIKMDREITVDITVNLVGNPIGAERGGELQVLKREVKVSGLPGALPEKIEIDVSGLNVGDTVKVADIVLTADVTVIDGEDVALATVAKTRTTLSDEEEAQAEGEAETAEGAEGETPAEAAATEA